MKASLKALSREMKQEAEPQAAPARADKSYPVALTRSDTRQVSAHYPAADVQAFRILAAELDMDVQELLAVAINMVFERHGRPNRVPVTSGRRKRRA